MKPRIRDLVNDDASLVSRRCWTDEYVYALEKQGIFGKSWLLHVTTPAKLGTYAYINPVVAMVLGVTIGGEVLPLRAWLASVIIILSVAMVTVNKSRAAKVSASGSKSSSTRPRSGRSRRFPG